MNNTQYYFNKNRHIISRFWVIGRRKISIVKYEYDEQGDPEIAYLEFLEHRITLQAL